ncbi:chemotaxis response regulator protein-glutamate methylesterase [Kineosporia sp. NBRC 101677]|uniref:protein-glutamate methylesterase/protein-glutamine glutaminase n=1 Tax=Kineosporia sp. NBRC 101677 TaxID=3032197 RepID=UPI0024A04581|nr:chemotaxis response regulator protein-glutamate methylesterase [Kineosporia sp. NBRC 101677]GLY13980.1 chemotaxis response regulator protein-glutamate methylesterase [Kineosporia sp. NBRC 101677]
MSGSLIRVLIVDDSVVIRRLIKEILDADPRIEVVGVAHNGQVAIGKVEELKPDAVTMDIEMPVMNGVDAVRALRKTHPRLPIVMFSTLTERGASATMDALAAGASDYVTKPANVGSVMESRKNISEQLVPKLVALTGARKVVGVARAPMPPPQPPAGQSRASGTTRRTQPFGLLAIGSSTGGPDALATVLSALPGELPVPVVITQHMPPVFTKMLAQRLNSTCKLSISEAAEGDSVERGKVLIAPGGLHMELKTRGTGVFVHLSDAPPENFCRPAVDVMFRSVAAVYRNRVLAVVLTGMGKDGALGAGVIRAAGGEVFAQDEATSVVWGMPGATVMAGQADRVLPLEQMAGTVTSALSANQGAGQGGSTRQANGPVPGGVRA